MQGLDGIHYLRWYSLVSQQLPHSISVDRLFHNFSSSVQLLLDLKPVCSCKTLYTVSFILFNITLQRTLLANGSKVMPLQFSQQLKSPFYGSFILLVFSQLPRFYLILYISIHISLLLFQRLGWYTINSYALPFFSDFKAFLISCLFILPTFMLRSSPGGKVTGLYLGLCTCFNVVNSFFHSTSFFDLLSCGMRHPFFLLVGFFQDFFAHILDDITSSSPFALNIQFLILTVKCVESIPQF